MTEEFNLSDKVYWHPKGIENSNGYFFKEEDVREFVRKLKEKVLTNWKGQNEFTDLIDKLSGFEEAGA